MKKTSREYSKELATTILRYLEEDDWKFVFDENSGTIDFYLSTKSIYRRFHFVIYINRSSFTTYTYPPIGADPDDKDLMNTLLEFAARMSYGLVTGNLEVDPRDGEVRYKVTCDCSKIIPSKDMLTNSIFISSITLKKYSYGIVGILLGEIRDAKAAIDKCENTSDGEVISPTDEKSEKTEESTPIVRDIDKVLTAFIGDSDATQ